MEHILNLLEQQKNWKEFIKKSCRRNKINVEIASYFTPNKVKTVYDRFFKMYQIKTQNDSTCWIENQLKAFHWFLAILSGLKERLIQNFTEQQWKTMNQIFLNKDESVMEYEAIKLVNQRVNKNRPWTQEQSQMLTQIIKENQNTNKWNDIARKLFQRSEHKFFRSGKQCRQRWLNHLDPNKKRGQWEEQEDKIIVNYILNYGRRWSNIAKQLGSHRTQHMVKNRFKTLIIRQKKITPRISNQNTLLRQIGKRIIGEEFLPVKKQAIVKEQIEQQQLDQQMVSEFEMDEQKNTLKKQSSSVKKTQVLISLPHQLKYQDQIIKKVEKKGAFDSLEQNQMFRDPIISQVIQECSKGLGSVSTPMSNYELQQIYSPFYINYQGITPYLSPSPQLPFFMNSSFSAFDNAFNNNLFIKSGNNGNTTQKKEENE